MTYPSIRLNSLSLTGPGRDTAKVEFQPGMNVIRGASDTGKSFIVACIDFMLGARDPLKKITESDGYNRVLLSFYSTGRNQDFTLVRGTQGGDFELFLGRHLDRPDTEPNQILKVSPQATPNISSFLLELVGLPDRRVMKNKDGETERLGFRNLVPLCIVNETQIQSETPPALSDQVVMQTKSKQVFKLLLTGVDDSGIVSKKAAKASKAKTQAQVELIDEMIAEVQEVIDGDGRSETDLSDQLNRLDATIADVKNVIGTTEDVFSKLRQRRFELRQRSDANDTRRGEIESLKQRLDFLDLHYLSDLGRLESLSEAGAIYEASEIASCAICGADPSHQKYHRRGEEEVRRASAAALAEIDKINVLRKELQETVTSLGAELVHLDGELPLLKDELAEINTQLKDRTPRLQEDRDRYAALLELRASLTAALDRYTQLARLAERKDTLNAPDEPREAPPTNVIDPGLSEPSLHSFSRSVETVLVSWQYPEPRMVSVREKDLELIVGGKPRASSGKGVRALLHSAFSLGLLKHTRTYALPHPGFVVLDSPLLTYAPPEGDEPQSEDDRAVSQTNLRENFFESLRAWPDETQVLVVENVAVPDWVVARSSTTVFTRNDMQGRYGFIPKRSTI